MLLVGKVTNISDLLRLAHAYVGGAGGMRSVPFNTRVVVESAGRDLHMK